MNDILTHGSIVGHSLQFLDNVYIQQLEGQQVLRTESTILGYLQWMLKPGFVLRGTCRPLSSTPSWTLFKFMPHLSQVKSRRLKWEQDVQITKWQEGEKMQWGWKWTRKAETQRRLKGSCGEAQDWVPNSEKKHLEACFHSPCYSMHLTRSSGQISNSPGTACG